MGTERIKRVCEQQGSERRENKRREVGVKEAPGLYCTSAHMSLPAAAVNVMITLPLQSQLLMGKGHVVFHAFFLTHIIIHK